MLHANESKITYPPHDGDGLQREESRVSDFIIHDAVKDLFFVVSREGRLSDEHLKDEDAKSPPIDCPRVRRLREHFGSEEFRRAAERSRPISKAHPFFTQSEIGNLNVAFCVQQQVIQLQVSVKGNTQNIYLFIIIRRREGLYKNIQTCKLSCSRAGTGGRGRHRLHRKRLSAL